MKGKEKRWWGFGYLGSSFFRLLSLIFHFTKILKIKHHGQRLQTHKKLKIDFQEAFVSYKN